MTTKAILLVGGKGTRLAPLTNNTPKPMLKVAGKPVTEHQIIKARDAGITELVLADVEGVYNVGTEKKSMYDLHLEELVHFFCWKPTDGGS